MEPPSVLLPTHVPCLQGLLLAASVLTIWNIPSAAAPAIEAVPPTVLEGKNVLLLAHNLPDNLSAYHWFKGKEPLDKDLIIMHEIKSQETKQGKLHSGRETLYPNGSLMLQNVTLKQSGIYNLNIRSAESDQKSMLVEVSIYPQLSKPSIRSNGTTAVEGQDTVEITCDPPFLKTTYTWRLNDKYFEEGKNLWLSCQATSHPKAQYSWNVNGEHWSSRQDIFIHKVNMSNSGLYTCHVNNPTTGRNDFKVKEITIVENLLKPHIQIRNRTVLENHLVDLTCVSENTGISILWTFNNERLKATDRVMFSWNNQRLTIRPITKEDAGAYQCEVSNPFISKLSDPVSLDVLYQPSQRNFPMSVPVAAALAVEVLAGLAILGGLAYFVFFKKLNQMRRKSMLSEDNWTHPPTVDEVAYSIVNVNAQQPKPPTSTSMLQQSHKRFSEVKKKNNGICPDFTVSFLTHSLPMGSGRWGLFPCSIHSASKLLPCPSVSADARHVGDWVSSHYSSRNGVGGE
ncbi:cell adhesion molecule CEACAM1-like isoform X5 [Peromyscus maniculatus bairdii]|uniref:cell adhesion molecule CEACAM1-like isoform X5 n=1 Tax=Peromyscus maniculatus bairdii TaxID=230844 RepID=UPI003FD6376E